MRFVGFNYKRKVISFFLILFLLVGLLSVSIFAKDNAYVLKLSHHHNVGGVADLVSNKFAELADEKSDGRLKVEIFPGAQLAQEREAAEGVLMGTLDMAFVSSSIFVNLVDGYGVDGLPFVLSSDWWKNVKLFNDSPVGELLDKSMLDKGGVNLGWGVYGARHLFFKEKDIKTLDDLKGLKMRSPEVDYFVEMYRVTDARPTAITWGETYTAMQTGLVDGMDAPYMSIVDTRLYEVSKYLLESSHMWATFNLVVNLDVFNRLPKDLQEIVLEAGSEAFDYVNEVAYEQVKGYAEFLQSKGMIFSKLSDEDRKKFAELTKPVVENWAKSHNAVEILNMIEQELAAN